jgi:anti-sigma regulatory factor (Ser/Thr protein kinase)
MSHSVAAYSTRGVCAICSAELPPEAKLSNVSGTAFGVRRDVRAGLLAPAEARRAVVPLPVPERTRRELELIVSELVTNSVRHAGLSAGDPIELEMTSDNGQVRIAVRDRGPGFEPNTAVNGNGGLGLSIVAAVATEWGVERSTDGCTVWCAVQR